MLVDSLSDPKTFARIDMLMDHVEHRASMANSINFQMAKVADLVVLNQQLLHHGQLSGDIIAEGVVVSARL